MGLGKKMGMLIVVVAVLLALGLSAGTALACDSNIIGDFVWNDLNANGIQNAGEPGIAGVTVELHKCCDDSKVGSTTTDANGKYLFTDVYHGSYYIKFVLPIGYTFSLQDQGTDNKVDSDANAAGVTACTYLYDSDDRTWDAGMYQQPASVGDFVWEDLNGNGIQDVGENGISGVTVDLYKCNDTFVATTTTGVSGNYSFSNLVPGSYYILFGLPSGYAFSLPNQGSDAAKDSDADSTGKTGCFTLNPGQNDLTWDAGMYLQPASVGDFVWNDANKNGIQDVGETGISGITVNLYKCGETTPVATVETDASGYYSFSDLVPGSYYLEFTTALNYVFSLQYQGSDPAFDSNADPSTGKTDCFTLNPGVNDLTLDVGLYVQEPHNPPVVPAISTWGIAGMVAAMAVVAGFMLRRRVTDSTR